MGQRRIARRAFRWVCRLIVLLVLLLLAAAIYLEKAGVPGFVKTRMVKAIRARGWEVEFSSLRFHWYRGIIAENMQLQRARGRPGPVIFLDEAACRLDGKALRNFDLQPQSVRLRGGRIIWPFRETNQQTVTFGLDKVGGELLFKPNDQWQLRSLSAEVLGASLLLSGTLSNASVVRDWKFPKSTKQTPEATQALWRRIVATAARVRFIGQPQLITRFNGDARDLQSLNAELRFLAAGIDTPWGAATNALLHIRVLPAQSSEPLQAELEFTAENAASEWCRARKLRLNWEIEPPFISLFPTNAHVAVDLLAPESPWAKAHHAVATVHVTPLQTNLALFRTEIHGAIDQLQSDWGQSDYSQVALSLVHSGTNLVPSNISGELRLNNSRTPWGEAVQGTIAAVVSLPPPARLALFHTNAPWPDRLEGLVLSSSITASNVFSPQVELEKLGLDLTWDSGVLRWRTDMSLYGGGLTATGQIDAASRELLFAGRSTFDPHQLGDLVTPNTQEWFAQYAWQAPPRVQASGRVTFPAWTNRHPDWMGEVRPTLKLAGAFELEAGAFREVPFTSAASSFFLTNLVWQIPDLRITRPEGLLSAEYSTDLATRDFHWRVHSQIDPKVARPLLEYESQRTGLDFFQFTQPPEIDAEVWNRWGGIERLGIVAKVHATNFAFRGEGVSGLSTRLSYTNQLLTFEDPLVRQGEQEASATRVLVDLAAEKVYLSNTFGNLDPNAVARAIGDTTAKAIAPYQFDSPPTTRVNGTVDLKRGRRVDNLHFQINGGPFRWRQYRLQRLQGDVDWVGDKLSLNNVRGAFRTGTLGGAAAFDFASGQDATFQFNLGITEADLRTFMPDVGYPTNRLEGFLTGEMLVRSGKTSDPKSWQGEGHLQLRDGLIWEIPMFGVFSPVLNSLVPGLGNSRAKQATATYGITNSVIFSHDLDIRATAMRMKFNGSIDFDGKIDGTIEAELLRDLPGLGLLISKLLWPITKIFEYKITGTVNHPNTAPNYVATKILLFPFHPIKTLKGLAPPEEPKPPAK